jgi:hypothetical protein
MSKFTLDKKKTAGCVLNLLVIGAASVITTLVLQADKLAIIDFSSYE